MRALPVAIVAAVLFSVASAQNSTIVVVGSDTANGAFGLSFAWVAEGVLSMTTGNESSPLPPNTTAHAYFGGLNDKVITAPAIGPFKRALTPPNDAWR